MSIKQKLSGLTLGVTAAALMTGAMVSSSAVAAEKYAGRCLWLSLHTLLG